MAFDGTEGAPESLAKAAAWTSAHRAANPNDTEAHFFGKDILNDILAQSGCVGIRIYHGIKNGERKVILVGVDSEENDMLANSECIANRSIIGTGENNQLNN